MEKKLSWPKIQVGDKLDLVSLGQISGKKHQVSNQSSSQQRLDQRFYLLTLNFEIPQVAYF